MGFGLHFAPHRPRAEFLRHPGSGGLRGATRPAPQHPPRAGPSAAAAGPARREHAAAWSVERGPRAWGRRERAGAGGRGRVPEAAAGVPGGGGRRRGRSPAERRLLERARSPRIRGLDGGVCVCVGVPQCPHNSPPPAPKPLEIEGLLKNRVVAMQPQLPDKTLRRGSNQLAGFRAPPTWKLRSCRCASSSAGLQPALWSAGFHRAHGGRRQSEVASVRVLKRRRASPGRDWRSRDLCILTELSSQQCHEPGTVVLFLKRGNCS